jgi:hypothetical protein
MNSGFAGVRKTQAKPSGFRFLLSAVDCAHVAISSFDGRQRDGFTNTQDDAIARRFACDAA